MKELVGFLATWNKTIFTCPDEKKTQEKRKENRHVESRNSTTITYSYALLFDVYHMYIGTS